MREDSQPGSVLNSQALKYKKLDVQTLVGSASPHRLIGMLFDGASSRLAQASGYAMRSDHESRSRCIGETVSIVDGLQASLDHEKGGELAANLDALYDYMQRRLFRANADNDVAAIREVMDLVRTLQEAWDAIDPSVTDTAIGRSE